MLMIAVVIAASSGIHRDIPDKRAVDFELADLKLSQVAEAGIASSESRQSPASPHGL
jgi:hypothetical protein